MTAFLNRLCKISLKKMTGYILTPDVLQNYNNHLNTCLFKDSLQELS